MKFSVDYSQKTSTINKRKLLTNISQILHLSSDSEKESENKKELL